MMKFLLTVCSLLIAISTSHRIGVRAIHTADANEDRVNKILAQMSLEEKVGQLFLVFFNGTTFSENVQRALDDYHVGGVVLFQSNIISATQTATLVNDMQKRSKIPLFVAVDQEGGLVSRLPPPAPVYPSQMALAATGDLDNAKRMAEAVSKQLRALGFNMNLAPVLDVNDNPSNPIIGTRAFGSDANTVSRFGAAMIETYKANGILAVAKHFPGHGSASVDSHFRLPAVRKDNSTLEAVELTPFKSAAKNADAIMTAHIVFPALDEGLLPATLSSRVLQNMLREKLGFKGVIMSDSMTMAAIDENYGRTKATVMAIKAGVDIIALGADIGISERAYRKNYEALLKAVREDAELQRRVEESVKRVLTLKAKYDLLNWKPVDVAAAESAMKNDAAWNLARSIARQSVTVVRNVTKLLPLKPNERVLLVAPNKKDRVGFYDVTVLSNALRACHAQLDVELIEIAPSRKEIAKIARAAKLYDKVIVAALNARYYAAQAQLVRAIDQPIFVALRNPYDLSVASDAPTFVTTYGDAPVSLEALAQALCGKIEVKGVLPIELK
jgi:beta-N-acetylhexosaminidase